MGKVRLATPLPEGAMSGNDATPRAVPTVNGLPSKNRTFVSLMIPLEFWSFSTVRFRVKFASSMLKGSISISMIFRS